MAGVEKIIDEILQDAQDRAQALIAEGEEKAGAAREQAQKEAQALKEQQQAKAEKDAQLYLSGVQSQIGLRRRQTLLSAKQEIISEVIDKAYQKLAGQDDDAYFAMIGRMLPAVIRPEEGEILFGKKDLDRLPADFAQKAAQLAAAKGGRLTVSAQPADIENGFVVRYGGIDENCTLRALFDEKLGQLQDEVNKALW